MADGKRRFEFGWLEVLGLILVFAGGSIGVFFLGVFVGKGLHESQLAREERVVRLPIDPIKGSIGSTAPAVAAAPKASPLQPRPTEVFRLAVRPAPSASPVTLGAPASPVPTVLAPTVVRDALRPDATVIPPRRELPAPRSSPISRTAIPSPSVAAEPERGRFGEARGTWAVQVNATRDAYTARKLVQKLQRLGYTAYAVEIQLRGELWYRVRVGRFATMEEATAMVVRLKNRENYRRAFLVQE